MNGWRNKQRLLGVAVALALLSSMVLGSASGLAMANVELLANGNFEGGFANQPGCGMVEGAAGAFYLFGYVVDRGVQLPHHFLYLGSGRDHAFAFGLLGLQLRNAGFFHSGLGFVAHLVGLCCLFAGLLHQLTQIFFHLA